MTIAFWNSRPKIPKKSFLILNLSVFGFSQNFAISQNWGCEFQVSQYHFQIPAQKYSNKGFLVPNLGIFFFSQNFGIRRSRGCWLQIWQYMFQLPLPKYPNSGNLRIVIFAPNFAATQIRGRWYYIIWQQYFQIRAPTYRNLTNNFYFLHETLQQGKLECADFKYDNGFSKLLPKTLK